MRRRARATRRTVHHPGKMNKTEARYAAHLELLKAAGKITDYCFEPLKLRLGADWTTSYLADFMVLLPDGTIELHEVKGASNSKESVKGAFWQKGSRTKIKTAARLFPFVFVGVHERAKKQGGGWEREVFSEVER